MSLDITELEPTTRNDYRRSNGAPMVMVNGKNERYSRPSSFAKPLDDESALVNWKIDRAAIGVAYDRALQAAYVAVEQDDRSTLRELREKAIAAGRGAERADIGTALHAMSVRFETDMTFSPPQPYLESLQAYMECMTRLNLSTMYSEFHTVNVEYRCAGTADRLYQLGSPLVTPDGDVLPVGTLIIGDLKTGEKLEYSKAAYAVQLALYASGKCYDVLLDDFIVTPAINQKWAFIVHMPAEEPGRCEFLWCDLEVGHHGAWLVSQIKLWRKMWRSGEYELPEVHLAPRGPAADKVIIDEPPPSPTMTSPVGPFDNSDELTGHIEWAKARLAQVAQHTGAKAALLIRWPEGLPPPKQITTLEQARDVHFLLDRIEADYELGFVPRPESIQTTGPTRKRKGQ